MTAENACPFCNVSAERIIRSNELFVSFLSNPRLRMGHVLIAPKRHTEMPMSLAAREITAIYSEIQRLQQRIIDAGLGQGCDTWQKYQPFVPQGRVKVDHVHFHVLPRNPADRLFMTPEENQWNIFEPLSEKEMTDVLKVLR